MHSRGSSPLVSEPGSGFPPEMLILLPLPNLFSSALIIKGYLEIICFATLTLPEIPLALKLNCSLPSSAHQISLFSAPVLFHFHFQANTLPLRLDFSGLLGSLEPKLRTEPPRYSPPV